MILSNFLANLRIFCKKIKLIETKMSARYFQNPYFSIEPDAGFNVNEKYVKQLITNYISSIVEHTKPENDEDRRGDLYVGVGGIAYMFLKLAQSNVLSKELNAISYAKHYIDRAKEYAKNYSKKADERCAFLCGNAGIYAVAALIDVEMQDSDEFIRDIQQFSRGFEACKPVNYSKYGGDEVLVGRAGYLSGCYWLNQNVNPPPIPDAKIIEICESMVESGRQYTRANNSPLPLMYQYHGSEYLGAAHGVCAIYQMLLQSSWFVAGTISQNKLNDIKNSIDGFLSLQDAEGNFPVTLESIKPHRKEKTLVHWCHGAPGAIYMLIKAYIIFKEQKYLNAAIKCAELVWQKGLLYKGPGICHGVAGNGYVFLVMYRLTGDQTYLFRASKFMEFLTNENFLGEARIPDRPFSLYEGLSGTICFLIDLLQPDKAAFPFMEVF